MKKIHKKELSFVITVFLLVSLLSFSLLGQSLGSTMFVFLSIVVWMSIYLYTKDLVLSSFLYIFFVLPFNITLQLSNPVEIFNTQFNFPSPYVNGSYVNYLVPTLSILDIAVLLTLSSFLITKGVFFFWNIFKSLKNGITLFLLFLVVQNIFLSNSLVIFNSFRLFFYLLLVVVSVNYYKKESFEKALLPASFLLLLNVLFQGVLGLLQVLRGSSLNLTFLGESQVVSGMIGSSFITLNGQQFLRAYGTFPHPNVFGGFLILTLLVGITSTKKIPGIGISLVILSLMILPLTFSRVPMLLSLVILLLLLIDSILKLKLQPKKNLKEKIFSFSPIFFLSRFSNLVKGEDSSWSDRLKLFKASLRVIRENFMLGTGPGNYVSAIEEFVPRTTKGILLLQPVHNIFLLLFAELGIFGFLIFLYILVYMMVKHVMKIDIFRISVLLSILGIGFWDHYLISLPQGMLIFIIMYMLIPLR